MAKDPQQDAIDRRRARVEAMLDKWAYREGADPDGPVAKRVSLSVLGSVGQAVWVTGDSLSFADYFYRPLLGLDVGSKDIGVMTGDGRWSFFNDMASYQKAKFKRPKGSKQSVRMMTGPFEDVLAIVLIVRTPESEWTEISVTVMPDDEDPRRA